MLSLPFDLMVADCDEYETRIVLAARNNRTGRLRATKPFKRIDYDCDEALFEARANYVWRMLCYDFCNFSPHNCMPITADWDISAFYNCREERNECSDRKGIEKANLDILDELIKRVESVMPITAQRGIMAAARAYGL